jgi:hypothetical protein
MSVPNDRLPVMTASVLDREMFSEAEASRILRVPQSTLHWWLSKVLVQVRADVTYPGDPGGTLHRRTRPACPITTTAVKDDVWIPQVASLGWLIITRDSRIARNRAEIAAVRDSGARMVALAGPEAVGTWAQLEALCCQWRALERRLDEPGPFIYSATRTALRPVSLN